MNYVLFTSCILLAISNILLIARTFHICLLIKYLVNRIVRGAGASSHGNFSLFFIFNNFLPIFPRRYSPFTCEVLLSLQAGSRHKREGMNWI